MYQRNLYHTDRPALLRDIISNFLTALYVGTCYATASILYAYGHRTST